MYPKQPNPILTQSKLANCLPEHCSVKTTVEDASSLLEYVELGFEFSSWKGISGIYTLCSIQRSLYLTGERIGEEGLFFCLFLEDSDGQRGSTLK